MIRKLLAPLFLLILAVNAHAALIITAKPARFADPDGTVPLTLSINTSLGTAEELQVSWFDTSHTITATSHDWNCSEAAATTTCKWTNVLSGDNPAELDLHFRFDQPYARRELSFSAQANANGSTVRTSVITGAVLYRRFIVTQAGDAGDGSLRAAVEALDADPLCADVPCSIDLDLATSTIALQSALPQIAGRDVLVDGTIHPGQITLDGAAVAGNALDFNVRERAEVDGVRIANFGDNAVLLRLRVRQAATDESPRLTVGGCTIEHNFRGINIAPGYLGGSSLIAHNVLRDNVRTAIFDGSLHDPAVPLQPPLRIEQNTITGNGASGIYFGPGSDGALVTGNVIESNHDFAIAVSRGARNVRILPNSIAHNGAAIDVGLDGPTPLLQEQTGDRSAAVIESARFDEATQTTIITGKPAVDPIGVCDLCSTHTVSIYRNDAAEHGQYAEAQTYLGEARPNGSGFIFTIKANLRGAYITALVTRWVNLVGSDFFDTAELSKAVLVQ